jgi:hypothetical protein
VKLVKIPDGSRFIDKISPFEKALILHEYFVEWS